MFNTLSGRLKSVLPILVLVAMAAVYGGSNWLSETVHRKLGTPETVQQATTQATPPRQVASDPQADPGAKPGSPPQALPIPTNPVDLLKRQVEQIQKQLDETKKPAESQQHEPVTIQSLVDKFLPMVTNFIIGALWLLFAYLIYGRVKSGLQRFLTHSKGSERGKLVVRRATALGYWVIAIFVGLSFMAPDLLTKLFLGVSIVGAAITLALQGVARDFVCGVFMQFSPKFEIGDEIQVVGIDVKGKVVDINYLNTFIQTADGKITISNGELWSKAVKVVANTPSAPPPPAPPEPKPQPIIVYCGCNQRRPKRFKRNF